MSFARASGLCRTFLFTKSWELIMRSDALGSSAPLVSIGMPVYNGAQFLRKSLDSILAQDFGHFELIISDNASTDGTEEICKEYLSKDRRIRYYRNAANMGAAENFNRVFRLSSSKYFMWAGDHDLWHPTWLSSCVQILEEDPTVAIAYSNTMLIDVADAPLGDMGDRIDTRGMNATERYRVLLYNLCWGNMVYGVHRSRWLKEVGGISSCCDVSWPDQLLLGSLALRGTFAQIPAPLFLRRKIRADETSEELLKRQDEMAEPATARSSKKLPHDLRKRRLRNRHLWAIACAPLTLSEKLVAAHTVIDYFETFHGIKAPIVSSLRRIAVALFSKQRLKNLLLAKK
jgi:glycosyltransferase involved in cell wall biosynthesis